MVLDSIAFLNRSSITYSVRRSIWLGASLPIFLTVACRSVPKEEQYVQADTSRDLAALVVKDLEEGNDRESYEALRAFTFANVGGELATYAHSVFVHARPVLAFQQYGAHRYVGAVSELENLLESASRRELKKLYQAFSVGDIATIRSSLAGERTPLSAGNVALDPELLPYRQFFEGAVALDDYRANAQRVPSDAWRVVDLMDRAAWSFSRKQRDEEYFFSLVVSAEALDYGGLSERAMAKWTLAEESSYWPSVSTDFRDLMKSKIAESKDRARRDAEVEAQARAEAESAAPAAGMGPPAPEAQNR